MKSALFRGEIVGELTKMVLFLLYQRWLNKHSKSKAVGRVSNGLGQTVDNKFVQSKDLNFYT